MTFCVCQGCSFKVCFSETCKSWARQILQEDFWSVACNKISYRQTILACALLFLFLWTLQYSYRNTVILIRSVSCRRTALSGPMQQVPKGSQVPASSWVNSSVRQNSSRGFHFANANAKYKPSSPYHVVADKPLMYDTQSKTPNSWRARRLPNIAVMDLTPPAAVTTATTGTCSKHKGTEALITRWNTGVMAGQKKVTATPDSGRFWLIHLFQGSA